MNRPDKHIYRHKKGKFVVRFKAGGKFVFSKCLPTLEEARAYRDLMAPRAKALREPTADERTVEILLREGPATRAQLAERLGLKENTLSYVAKRLMAAGLAHELPRPQDARISHGGCARMLSAGPSPTQPAKDETLMTIRARKLVDLLTQKPRCTIEELAAAAKISREMARRALTAARRSGAKIIYTIGYDNAGNPAKKALYSVGERQEDQHAKPPRTAKKKEPKAQPEPDAIQRIRKYAGNPFGAVLMGLETEP